MKMSENLKYEKQLTFSKITVQITELGEDYHIMLWGGDKPHIGCTSGFHYDNISSLQIQEVLAAVREICENII